MKKGNLFPIILILLILPLLAETREKITSAGFKKYIFEHFEALSKSMLKENLGLKENVLLHPFVLKNRPQQAPESDQFDLCLRRLIRSQSTLSLQSATIWCAHNFKGGIYNNKNSSYIHFLGDIETLTLLGPYPEALKKTAKKIHRCQDQNNFLGTFIDRFKGPYPFKDKDQGEKQNFLTSILKTSDQFSALFNTPNKRPKDTLALLSEQEEFYHQQSFFKFIIRNIMLQYHCTGPEIRDSLVQTIKNMLIFNQSIENVPYPIEFEELCLTLSSDYNYLFPELFNQQLTRNCAKNSKNTCSGVRDQKTGLCTYIQCQEFIEQDLRYLELINYQENSINTDRSLFLYEKRDSLFFKLQQLPGRDFLSLTKSCELETKEKAAQGLSFDLSIFAQKKISSFANDLMKPHDFLPGLAQQLTRPSHLFPGDREELDHFLTTIYSKPNCELLFQQGGAANNIVLFLDVYPYCEEMI